MRLVMAMVLAGLAALPLGASAQEVEEGATSEPSAEEPAPSAEPAPKEPVRGVQRRHPEAFVDPSKPASEPALKLEVDSSEVEVTPPATPTIEELVRRAKRKRRSRGAKAGIAVGVIVGAILVGTVIAIAVEDYPL